MTYDYTAYFDGSCGPVNPGGIAGYGAIIFDSQGKFVWQCSEIYSPEEKGITSNNVAEYCGAIAILRYFADKELTGERILIKGDSKLVIEQLSGRWKVKKGMYKPQALEARNILTGFDDVTFRWIPREKNLEADYLSTACYNKDLKYVTRF